MSASELFTIGYEGRGIGDFVGYLKHFKISCLIDVREIPISRKPGFSKKPSAKNLKMEILLIFI
jgi:uncharacterized protein (DUF488 family)